MFGIILFVLKKIISKLFTIKELIKIFLRKSISLEQLIF